MTLILSVGGQPNFVIFFFSLPYQLRAAPGLTASVLNPMDPNDLNYCTVQYFREKVRFPNDHKVVE
jgi:hypothetical protein